eukprot:48946-Pyramimonas_sp.AAC.1
MTRAATMAQEASETAPNGPKAAQRSQHHRLSHGWGTWGRRHLAGLPSTPDGHTGLQGGPRTAPGGPQRGPTIPL